MAHVLSPYIQQRSALTDVDKLLSSGFDCRFGILMYGYDYSAYPLEELVAAWETLARRRTQLGPRTSASFDGLVHPVHQAGAVFGWQLL